MTDCWCDGAEENNLPTQAHHTMPKGDGQDLVLAEELRACASNRHDIDVDDRVNGTCLPDSSTTGQEGNSSAIPHPGNSSLLHGSETMQLLLDACDTLSTPAFRQFLRDVARGYTEGIPLGPFV
ncbi:MAG: hypothetical protein AAGA68_20605 [Pseudomonadota bacterium]